LTSGDSRESKIHAKLSNLATEKISGSIIALASTTLVCTHLTSLPIHPLVLPLIKIPRNLEEIFLANLMQKSPKKFVANRKKNTPSITCWGVVGNARWEFIITLKPNSL
jgi:hypothetical protein